MKDNRISRMMQLLTALQSRRGCAISELTEILGKNRTIFGKSSFHGAKHRLSPLDKYFVEDEKFDLREYFDYAWSLLRQGRIYDVELRFSPQIAAEVAEVRWHNTQTVSFEDDGAATLKFRVDGLNEITWWILGYGDQVEVLSPPVLRQKIAQIASKQADFHQF